MKRNQTMECIYCRTEFEWKAGMQGDHVIPDAMGAFYGGFKFKGICQPCNRKRSKEENVLIRCSPISTVLKELSPLRDREIRKGKKSVPAEGVSVPMFERIYDDHTELVEYLDGNKFKEQDVLVFKPSDKDASVSVPIFPTMTKASFAKIFTEHPDKRFWFHCLEKNVPGYLEIIRELKPDLQYDDLGSDEPGQMSRIVCRVRYEYSIKQMQAVAKIAFHYFLCQCESEISGKEDRYAAIRNFIENGGNEKLFFRWGIVYKKDLSFQGYRHRLQAEYFRNSSKVVLSLFDGPTPTAFVCEVNLSPFAMPLETRHIKTYHEYHYRGTVDKKEKGIVGTISTLNKPVSLLSTPKNTFTNLTA